MRTLLPIAAVSAFAFVSPSWGQPAGAIAVESVDAVVTVVKVDEKERTVLVRGPRGDLAQIGVPPEAQNLDQVKPGARFRMTYVESAAVTITRGGKASVGAEETVKLAPRGGTPGGIVVRKLQVSGTVDAIDYDSRYITLKGPQGRVQSFRVANEVKGLEQINGGDRISVTYTQALAVRMLPAQK